jgi:aldehyde decarbonylase
LQVWLVGDGLTALEQERAQPGVHFVPYSQFPPMNTRGDCVYHSTPALVVPDSYENLHACEVKIIRAHRTFLYSSIEKMN